MTIGEAPERSVRARSRARACAASKFPGFYATEEDTNPPFEPRGRVPGLGRTTPCGVALPRDTVLSRKKGKPTAVETETQGA